MQVKLAPCRMRATCTFDWNRYAYVRHNPMIYTDPTGHVPILIPLAIIAAKVALKAAPAVVAGTAIAHRAAPAVHRAAVTVQRVATSAAQSGKSLARDSAMDAVVGGGIDLVVQVSSGQTVDLRQTAGAAVGNIVASRTYAPFANRLGTSFEDRLVKFVAATGAGAMGGTVSDLIQGDNGQNMVAGSLTQPAGSAVSSFTERRTNRNIVGAVAGEVTNRVLQDVLRSAPNLLNPSAPYSPSGGGSGMRAQ